MPTTNNEAQRIIEITQQYVPFANIKPLFTRLDDEVGKKTDNDSLRTSLAMMRGLVSRLPDDPPADESRGGGPAWLWGPLLVLIAAHLALVFGFVAAFCIIPLAVAEGHVPWFLALPIMTFQFFFATTRVECQLTRAENYLRRRLGLKRIGGFIGHYFVKPVRRWSNRTQPAQAIQTVAS